MHGLREAFVAFALARCNAHAIRTPQVAAVGKIHYVAHTLVGANALSVQARLVADRLTVRTGVDDKLMARMAFAYVRCNTTSTMAWFITSRLAYLIWPIVSW